MMRYVIVDTRARYTDTRYFRCRCRPLAYYRRYGAFMARVRDDGRRYALRQATSFIELRIGARIRIHAADITLLIAACLIRR